MKKGQKELADSSAKTISQGGTRYYACSCTPNDTTTGKGEQGMEENVIDVYEALQAVQMELKAPKDKYNSFGKYKYRSAESILEAAKPILKKHNATLYLTDDMVCVGDRNYVKASAMFSVYGGEIVATAYAREDPVKKGMDGSQITGTASSYARKYALNGLFLIDDTKDADTDEYRTENDAREAEQEPEPKKISTKQVTVLRNMAKRHEMPETVICGMYGKKTLEEMTVNDWCEWGKVGEGVLNEWDSKRERS